MADKIWADYAARLKQVVADKEVNDAGVPMTLGTEDNHKLKLYCGREDLAADARSVFDADSCKGDGSNWQCPQCLSCQRCQTAEVKRSISQLLATGSDLNVKNTDNEPWMIVSSRYGLSNEVRLLVDRAADVNAQGGEYGWTALINAAFYGHHAAVDVLIKGGASVDMQDGFKMTALMFAARNGHRAAVDVLIKGGASVDMQHTSEQTALIFAAADGEKEREEQLAAVTKTLLRHGADPAFQARGKTAKEFAQEENKPLVVAAYDEWEEAQQRALVQIKLPKVQDIPEDWRSRPQYWSKLVGRELRHTSDQLKQAFGNGFASKGLTLVSFVQLQTPGYWREYTGARWSIGQMLRDNAPTKAVSALTGSVQQALGFAPTDLEIAGQVNEVYLLLPVSLEQAGNMGKPGFDQQLLIQEAVPSLGPCVLLYPTWEAAYEHAPKSPEGLRALVLCRVTLGASLQVAAGTSLETIKEGLKTHQSVMLGSSDTAQVQFAVYRSQQVYCETVVVIGSGKPSLAFEDFATEVKAAVSGLRFVALNLGKAPETRTEPDRDDPQAPAARRVLKALQDLTASTSRILVVPDQLQARCQVKLSRSGPLPDGCLQPGLVGTVKEVVGDDYHVECNGTVTVYNKSQVESAVEPGMVLPDGAIITFDSDAEVRREQLRGLEEEYLVFYPPAEPIALLVLMRKGTFSDVDAHAVTQQDGHLCRGLLELELGVRGHKLSQRIHLLAVNLKATGGMHLARQSAPFDQVMGGDFGRDALTKLLSQADGRVKLSMLLEKHAKLAEQKQVGDGVASASTFLFPNIGFEALPESWAGDADAYKSAPTCVFFQRRATPYDTVLLSLGGPDSWLDLRHVSQQRLLRYQVDKAPWHHGKSFGQFTVEALINFGEQNVKPVFLRSLVEFTNGQVGQAAGLNASVLKPNEKHLGRQFRFNGQKILELCRVVEGRLCTPVDGGFAKMLRIIDALRTHFTTFGLKIAAVEDGFHLPDGSGCPTMRIAVKSIKHSNFVSTLVLHFEGLEPAEETQEHAELKLLDAAITDNVSELVEAIQAGASVNLTMTRGGLTALHLAATHGHSDIVTTLLEHKASPCCFGGTTSVPLELAVQRGRWSTVSILLDAMLRISKMPEV